MYKTSRRGHEVITLPREVRVKRTREI